MIKGVVQIHPGGHIGSSFLYVLGLLSQLLAF